jgi:hypothetical protein
MLTPEEAFNNEVKAREEVVTVMQLYAGIYQVQLGKPWFGANWVNPEESKNWNAFARATHVIRQLRVEPEDYLLAQFACNRAPFPNQLAGEQALRRFENYKYFATRRYRNLRGAPKPLDVRKSYGAAFATSAKRLVSYVEEGLTRQEVYDFMPTKFSPYFILADPDNPSVLGEVVPAEHTGLVGAWKILRSSPALRRQLNELWRETWETFGNRRAPSKQQPMPSSL